MVNIYGRYSGKYSSRDTWGINTVSGPIATSFTDDRIFVNENLSFKYTHRDIFSAYYLDESMYPDVVHGKLYRYQLNFALYCITTVCEVSLQHLNSGSELLKSVYRFYIYYSIPRIFKIIGAAVPGETGFNRVNNTYNKGGMKWIESEFGVNVSGEFMSARFIKYVAARERIDAVAAALNKMAGKDVYNKKFLKAPMILNHNPVKYVPKASKGITDIGVVWLSDSAWAYVYLLLTAQSEVRSSFGSGRDAEIISAFSSSLEKYVGRKGDIGDDIKRFEGVLDKAGSEVNFAIGHGIYMIPGNMVLRMGNNIKGYNNHVLVSSGSSVGSVNVGNVAKTQEKIPETSSKEPETSKKAPDRSKKAPVIHKIEPVVHSEVHNNRAKNEEYEKEVVAAGIVLTVASALFLSFYAPV